jgi:hypothetical protein
MTLRNESTVLAGSVVLFVLGCFGLGLVAVTPQDRLRWIFWVSGVADGQLTEQEP